MKKGYYKKTYTRKPLANQRIRAREVRVVDENGNQLGVIPTHEALKIANERNLDLVQVTDKVEPPVCKILDYGKYLYALGKKERKGKTETKRTGEIKGIRLSFGISQHDLETRVNQTVKFLNKGYRVRIEMQLKGRQKAYTLADFAKAKIQKFLEELKQKIPIKIEKDLIKQPRGLIMIISKL